MNFFIHDLHSDGTDFDMNELNVDGFHYGVYNNKEPCPNIYGYTFHCDTLETAYRLRTHLQNLPDEVVATSLATMKGSLSQRITLESFT